MAITYAWECRYGMVYNSHLGDGVGFGNYGFHLYVEWAIEGSGACDLYANSK